MMEASYYWLISITTEAITVGLIKRDSPDQLLSLGPETAWESGSEDSFLHSVDISLSEAAQKAALDPEMEPESTAFILPPKWIGNDGKINSNYLKLLETLCHSLKLKPLGFISNDEAFIESVSQKDSFPSSFILLYLGQHEFSLSLIYLGEVKKRYYQNLENDFTPEDLENALVTIRLDSALPPRILLFGHLSPSLVDDIKNYSWIGKKSVETFLHLPDVEVYQPEDLFNLYCRTVASQLSPSSGASPSSPLPNQEITEAETDTEVETESENIPEAIPNPEPIISETPINEVSSEDLGFTEIVDTPLPPPPAPKAPLLLPKIKLPSFRLPKLSLPHIHFKSIYAIPLGLFPLLFLLPYYLISSELTINYTPIEFDQNFNVTLDSTISDPTSSKIPVLKKTYDLSFTESLPASGQKETGDKSKGEITIFNKSDKIQNVAKGAILLDSAGKKYELLTSVQTPASTFNLGTGTITMGQTKANIIAADIGPEFNQNKDAQFSFKDNANLLAKVNDSITGGTRRQVQVVSAQDKQDLAKQVETSIQNQIAEKNKNLGADIFASTSNLDHKRLDYNREVGEESDTLSVKVDITVSQFQIDQAKKEAVLTTLFSGNNNFSQSTSSLSDFSFTFSADTTDSQKSTGKLSIKGRSLPKVDIDFLRRQLAGKSLANAKKIIISQPKVYNYDIKIMPSLFSFIGRLPPTPEKITIIQKY